MKEKRRKYKQLTLISENTPEYDTSSQGKKPLRIYTKKSLIEELIKIRKMGWIANSRVGNVGGVGNTLEDLLGIKENNLPLPNANEWELKTQRSATTALTTLFHMEPSPRALKFVPRVFLPLYGWKHEKAGADYPPDEMSFRQTISANQRSDRGFKVVVDRNKEKVLISFDSNAIDTRHSDWKNSVQHRVGLQELNPQPYWGFKDLRNKASTKLLNCFYVLADTKKIEGQAYFHYNKILILSDFNFEGLLFGMEKGFVFIDFDARTGHNHGTKFRVRKNHWPEFYHSIKVI